VLKPITVFVIEPSKLAGDSICHVLEERGFEAILSAGSLPEADQELECQTPDLILMSMTAVRAHVHWLFRRIPAAMMDSLGRYRAPIRQANWEASQWTH
jgi:hypothetical protein